MQVLVVGAGVIGLAVARAAAQAGHEVTIAEATGGIANGILNNHAQATLINTTISGNTATGAYGDSGTGGQRADGHRRRCDYSRSAPCGRGSAGPHPSLFLGPAGLAVGLAPKERRYGRTRPIRPPGRLFDAVPLVPPLRRGLAATD